MNEFTQAADTIKDAVLLEYAKSNPEVKQDAILEQSKSGKIVFETIDQLFDNLRSHDKESSESNGVSYRLLTMEEDERYIECTSSSKQTRSMCEFLANDKSSKLNVLEKNRIIDLLKKREWLCANQGAESRIAKREMMKMMDSLENTLSLVESSIKQYVAATNQQLECQRDIFEQEVEIGGQFAPLIQAYVNSIFKNRKNDSTNRSTIQLANAFRVLRQNNTVSHDEVTGLNQQLLENSILSFQNHLSQRKQQVDEIKSLLPVVDKINQLLESGAGTLQKAKPEKPADKPQESNRMAFMSKSFSGLFSRKK